MEFQPIAAGPRGWAQAAQARPTLTTQRCVHSFVLLLVRLDLSNVKGDLLEKRIQAAQAVSWDELSMHPPDVYHAGYRFFLLRQEHLKLDLSQYLEQWYGDVPIGIQLADFLQLRPTAQKSLCKWRTSKSILSTKMYRILKGRQTTMSATTRNWTAALQKFLAAGRALHRYWTDCSSGRQLVEVLNHTRTGTSTSDALRAALEFRSYNPEGLANPELQSALLRAHWGKFAWEQVARLQHIRAGLEARQAKKILSKVNHHIRKPRFQGKVLKSAFCIFFFFNHF